MKKTLLLLTLALLPVSADPVADAAAQLRAGDAAAALQTLTQTEGAEAAFWRGRALIALGRPSQAVEPLQQVPQEHALFPYAAKALLYCAWQSAKVNPDDVLPPLLHCENKDIRDLATAALAEYHLNRDAASGADQLMLHLRELADEDESLRPLLNLLGIAERRRKGDYNGAIEQCRRLERDRSLPQLTRHRVRLALAEVYYAQEAAHADTAPSAAGGDEEDEAEELPQTEMPVARGRGEETLLHFVSSNPESPLLEEAFRRLMLHDAFLSGEAARERLKEWSNDLRYPRRAALSLLVQQHLLNPDDAPELLPDATCVNAAVAALPKEAATDTMLLEQVRLQEQRGNRTEAALYLAQVQTPSLRRDFLAACLIDNHTKAARAFLSIARAADEVLQPAAYHNALLHALIAGDTATADAIEHESGIPAETARRLRALGAAYQAEQDPAAAVPLLRELLDDELPADLFIEVALDTAALQLAHPELFNDAPFDAEAAMRERALNEEQLQRLIALREQEFRAKGNDAAALETIVLAAAATQQPHPHLHAVLCIHLSHLLSAEGRHAEALRTLQHLIKAQPKGEFTPRTRMLAARQAELIGTADSLRNAAAIYGQCAEDATPQADRCALRRAAVLSRLGETEQARAIIDDKLKQEERMSKEDRMIAYAILSNILALEGTPDSLQAAVHAASQMLGDPALSPRHQALSLLHHGMICTRAGKADIALGDYLAVLRMKPAAPVVPEERDMQTLRRAAAGAVYAYCNTGRYEEAAKLADEAAAWPVPADKTSIRDSFSAWAQNIRKTNFLKATE